MRLVIYPNDHPPPHSHIIGPGWTIKIRLTKPPSLQSVCGNPNKGEITLALLAANENLSTLRKIWKKIHDCE